MSAARIIPFPIAAQTDLSHTLAGFTNASKSEDQPVTTVVITPAQGDSWVPPLSHRYPSVFASFTHWAAAERVGEELIIR